MKRQDKLEITKHRIKITQLPPKMGVKAEECMCQTLHMKGQ